MNSHMDSHMTSPMDLCELGLSHFVVHLHLQVLGVVHNVWCRHLELAVKVSKYSSILYGIFN